MPTKARNQKRHIKLINNPRIRRNPSNNVTMNIKTRHNILLHVADPLAGAKLLTDIIQTHTVLKT